MRHARKTDKILRLEGHNPIEPQQSDPFPELSKILEPKAIVRASEESLGLKGKTVAECLPRLTVIAKEEGLNLNRKRDWDKAINLLKSNR